MKNKVIHIVLGKANPQRMNGVNKVVNSLAENQALLGQNVSVWGITKNPTHNYPSRNYKTKLFKDIGKFKLSNLLKQKLAGLKKGTTVHLHGGFIPQFYQVALLLTKMGIPYILTPHGAYNKIALQRSHLKKQIYIRLFESFLVKNAKAIHLIGESEIQGTISVFKEVPYCLIPNGQEVPSCSTTISKIGNNAPVFGFVGRLDMHTKGLDLLVKGFAQFIEKSGFPCQLWLIGDGPDREKIEQLARSLMIERHMKFLGAKYGIEKDQLIQQMDYLCLTSRNEGLPGVVLEAAALGTPVLVSQETNMGRYIEKSRAGFVLPTNSSDAIAHTLKKAFKYILTKASQNQAKAAQRMVNKHFNWRQIALQHLDLYAA